MLQRVLKWRAIEEILPFVTYLCRHREFSVAIFGAEPASESTISSYRRLSMDELKQRLREEADRATLLDEKTSKMTLAFTLSLGILGASAALVRDVRSPFDALTVYGVVISVAYILSGGLIALASFRTFPRFGYGTEFSLHTKQAGDPLEPFVKALLQQEMANQLRQVRNEAAYQCLRNGFVVFVAVLVVYLFVTPYRQRTLTVSAPAPAGVTPAGHLPRPYVNSDLNSQPFGRFHPGTTGAQ